jgi:hypothetical protein
MTVEAPSDKRHSSRRRVYKGAHISFHGLHATIDCVVKNYSESGARLAFETTVGVPNTFDLVRDGSPSRNCRVVWRLSEEVGVIFE